ncbi:MAG: CapA family protein [Clostridia bacterium]|nr:CapA family protein [Clostridia bacterium]
MKKLIGILLIMMAFAVPALAEDSVTISFVGDCSIGDSAQYMDYESSYHTCLNKNGMEWPFSLVKHYLEADDLTVANLEVVFTNRRQHADKVYYLKGNPENVQCLTLGSIEMVNTINNHSFDFFEKGYDDTLQVLEDAGISHFGSYRPGKEGGYDNLATVEIKGIRFGFLGFSYPQDSDQKRIAQRIETLKNEQSCDVVVVSLHWGRETHMTPESWQYKYAKQVMDAGADMIWGHHPHVIQPIHFYNGKPILYSTGNFTFGTMSHVDPSTGIFQVTFQRDGEGNVDVTKLQVIPCETQRSPDYRPFELEDEAERKAVFKELRFKKDVYKFFDNVPESFLETGVVELKDGVFVTE